MDLWPSVSLIPLPAIAPVGGTKPVIGTNPMSFAVPGRKGKIEFLIDQSSSAVTWTAIKRAAEEGRPIPLGWALDAGGHPTTDASQGLAGSMAPSGGYKGFGQGLIVEVMCAALADSFRGPQMGSFMDNDGKPIGCGQFFIAISPKLFSPGNFDKQIRALARSITSQPGARMPNARREANRKRLSREGIPIDKSLYRAPQELLQMNLRVRPAPRRRATDIAQKPWAQLVNPFPHARLISDDAVEAIHLAALRILETIGVRCAVPEAQAIFRKAGAMIDPSDGRIRLGRDIVMAALAPAPSEFTLVPRNARRSCRIGGDYLATAAVLGPPTAATLLRGRRSGTLADLVRIAQAHPIL